MTSRNYVTAVLTHVAIMVGSFLLAVPWARSWARRYVYAPGEGPTKEEYKNDHFEYRGVAYPDVKTKTSVRAFCSARFEGSVYDCMSTFQFPSMIMELI